MFDDGGAIEDEGVREDEGGGSIGCGFGGVCVCSMEGE